MGEWFSIEVFDARFSARSWAESYGDSLLYAAQLEGATDWNWHYHGWGAVLEIELPDEFTWERFCEAPVVQAALDAAPDPVHGLLLHRGRGGSAGSRYPRRPRPFTGAGSAELPLPEEEVERPIACPSAILMG